MNILQIPLKELVVDEVIALSGRTDRERKENAKELLPMLKNGWDEAQPGQVFKREGKWHVAAGFTRIYALQNLSPNDNHIGYFVEVPDDRSQLRVAAIRTNAGKPISNLAMGKVFMEMEAGDDPASAPVGSVILEPMSRKEIASTAGITEQHVSYCIAVASSPKEIQELLEDGSVNANVVYRAKQLATSKEEGEKVLDEAKWIKAIKASIRAAKERGVESATMVDLDTIKADVFPLKADKPKKPAKPADSEKEEDSEENEQKEHKPKSETTGDTPSFNLGESGPAPTPAPKKLSAAEKKEARQKLIDAFAVQLRKADETYEGENDISFDDEQVEHIAAHLVDSGALLPESIL